MFVRAVRVRACVCGCGCVRACVRMCMRGVRACALGRCVHRYVLDSEQATIGRITVLNATGMQVMHTWVFDLRCRMPTNVVGYNFD